MGFVINSSSLIFFCEVTNRISFFMLVIPLCIAVDNVNLCTALIGLFTGQPIDVNVPLQFIW